jgi:hypothetical protein
MNSLSGMSGEQVRFGKMRMALIRQPPKSNHDGISARVPQPTVSQAPSFAERWILSTSV